MTVSCYSNSSPMAPDITINQTTVTLDGNTTLWHNETFFLADSEDPLVGEVFQLESVPVADESVLVFRNATALRKTTDYTLEGDYITLTTPLTAGEQLLVQYISATGVTSTSVRGTIMGLAGTLAPSGWLIMENTTPYAGVTSGQYAALYAWIAADAGRVAAMIDHLDGNNFYLKNVSISLYSGGVFTTVQAIIKT